MPRASSALPGGMKRVNTVRSGQWEASRTTDGRDFPIQGVDQGPPGANRFCMSMHRWIAFGPGGTSDDPITSRSSRAAIPSEEAYCSFEYRAYGKACCNIARPVRKKGNARQYKACASAPGKITVPRREFGRGRGQRPDVDGMTRRKGVETLSGKWSAMQMRFDA